jgi:hypothetical protein
MKTDSSVSCSTTFSHVLADAAVDVLGQSDVDNLAPLAQDNIVVDAFMESLKKHYGPTGSRGVAQRIGKAAFKYFLVSYGSELNLTNLDYRLLPSKKRVKTGLETVSRKLGEEFGAQIQLDCDDGSFYWRIAGEDGVGDFAYLLAGMAQELMSWSGGGRVYSVRGMMETNECVLKMDRKPLEF